MKSMKKMLVALAMGATMFAGSVSFAADEAKPTGTNKESTPATPAASTTKLVKPWGDLKTLSEEQRVKIEAIHKKALAEINTIEKKEKEDITALLTDANKSEIKDLADQKKKAAAGKKVDEKKTEEKKADAK